jgi:tRNA(Ser,Leu) C12 N-acetylase TAN1
MTGPRGETQRHPETADWNVIVTSRSGTQRDLRRALRFLVRLRRGGFRNILVGRVEDPVAFLDGVAALLERQPFVEAWLGRLLVVERTFPVERESFEARLREETAPLLDRIAGHSFHVRVERRGHKGSIDTQETERALGDFVYTTLHERGDACRVSFSDPDLVLAVEIVGDLAGLALVSRELRERYPFVRID